MKNVVTRAGEPQQLTVSAVSGPNVTKETFADKISDAMKRLEELDLTAPWITPADIAPLFGISRDAVYKHCRAYHLTQNWNRGEYRFMTDDTEHMEILRGLIGRILMSKRRSNGKTKRNDCV